MKEEGLTLIKPIDTQVLYPQTPEIAGRQHRTNQLPSEQQTQFGNLMKKEVDEKRDTIIPSQKAEDLKTNKDAGKHLADQNPKGSKKKQKQKETAKEKAPESSRRTIDIRI